MRDHGLGGLGKASKTRRYVQDERYFAMEHMDVRREAFQDCSAYLGIGAGFPAGYGL